MTEQKRPVLTLKRK
ncbi:hypothetical protein ACNS41_004681, partial [Escherichia coli]|nr:hypothetical protein [Escherichia coli]